MFIVVALPMSNLCTQFIHIRREHGMYLNELEKNYRCLNILLFYYNATYYIFS